MDDEADGSADEGVPARASDPTLSWLVAGLAAVGLVVVLGLVLVQRVGTTYRDGLAAAAESANLAADGAQPIVAITAELVAFAGVAETGLADTRSLLGTARTSLDELGVSAQEDLAVTTEALARLADRVAGVLESIERFVPGDRSSAAEDLQAIAEGLAPVPADLRDLGTQLQDTATELGELDPTLDEVGRTVASLGDSLAELSPRVEDLADTAARLVTRVDDARSRVDVDLWLARLVVLFVGVALGVLLVLTARRPPGSER